MTMSKTYDLHELYASAVRMTSTIYLLNGDNKDDKQFNSLIDDLTEIQEKNNNLLHQVLSALRTKRHYPKEFKEKYG